MQNKAYLATAILCGMGNGWADDMPLELKPGGVSLEYYSQQQAVRLNQLHLGHPALAPLEAARGEIKTDTEAHATGIKLDHWVRPYLNVFGAVARSRGDVLVRFSELPGVTLPDMTIEFEGMVYHAGATGVYRDEDYFGALTYIYTLSDMEGNDETNTAQTFIPTVGKLTDIGAFTLGIMYQQAEGGYRGTLDAPVLGPVDADVTAENAEKISYLLGYHKRLGSDWYLRANLETGEREGFKLELNRRF